MNEKKANILKYFSSQDEFQTSEKALKSVLNPENTQKKQLDTLGRYTIIEKIGSGGMGTIYKAYDPDLDRIIALKMLHTNITERSVSRFLREAKVTASLKHPHIVTLYDIGLQQGEPYFTMDYIEGAPLNDKKHLRLSLIQKIQLIIKIGKALKYAHNMGVIHRDIKPSNIIIDKSGEPKILDFGLAKTRKETQKLSQTGSVLGTLLYMAPEQLKGQSKEVDQRSDIYGLGGVFFYLLTGVPPFTGENIPEIIPKILYKFPPFPSKLKNNIDKKIDSICLKALAKKQNKRYQTIQAFIDDLLRFLENKTPKAHTYISQNLIVFLCFVCICSFLIYFSYRKSNRILQTKNNYPHKNTLKIPKQIPIFIEPIKFNTLNAKIFSLRAKINRARKNRQWKKIRLLSLKIAKLSHEIYHRGQEVLFLSKAQPTLENLEHLAYCYEQSQMYVHAKFYLEKIMTLYPRNISVNRKAKLQLTKLKKREKKNNSLSLSHKKLRNFLRQLQYANLRKWNRKNKKVRDVLFSIFHNAQKEFPSITPFIKSLQILVLLNENNKKKAKYILQNTSLSIKNTNNPLLSDGKFPEYFFAQAVFFLACHKEEQARKIFVQLSKSFYGDNLLLKIIRRYQVNMDRGRPFYEWKSFMIPETLDFMLEIFAVRVLNNCMNVKNRKSIETLQNLLSLETKKNYLIHYRLGIYFHFLSELKKAKMHLLLANIWLPSFTEPLFVLGEVYYKEKQYKKAKKCFQYVIQNPPKWAEQMQNKSYEYLSKLRNKK